MVEKKSSIPSSRLFLTGVFLLLFSFYYSYSANNSLTSFMVSQNWKQPELRNHVVPSSSFEFPSTVFSSWWDEITFAGSTSCKDVRHHEQEGIWKDPNDGSYFIRKIKKAPNHYVSLHKNEYDPVRFRHIFLTGNYYEHDVHNRFELILAEADRTNIATSRSLPMVVDVGANIGYYSLLSAARQHAVVAFEINPSNLIRLCDSIELNTHFHSDNKDKDPTAFFGPIRMFRNGVSSQHNQTLHYAVPKHNPGEASIQVLSEENKNHRLQLESFANGTSTNDPSFTTTITLDQFASDHGWLTSIPTTRNKNDDTSNTKDIDIAILKIDTEGHEPYILQGASQLIHSHLIRNILIEYRSHCRDAVLQYVLEADYVLVDDKPSKNKWRMLTTEASIDYIDKLQNRTAYVDLWFRLASQKLPEW
ncbi:FkbM family methyltransferase [Nitzschia inconspicua]|uniref:FkbM family methyltransferase n=1 Tax=Nitzschia inconspicua TaxID=303405 RepID=A0A9K3LX51_9STRA|nr:FkbM family methyltransferase [Nitzschia inconspicua]